VSRDVPESQRVILPPDLPHRPRWVESTEPGCSRRPVFSPANESDPPPPYHAALQERGSRRPRSAEGQEESTTSV
jgi:hypothetical protein